MTDYVIVPREATDGMVYALRTGSRADYPSDELCKVRYTALLHKVPEHNLVTIDKDDLEALRKDAERLDWLADPNNYLGAVSLPAECVKRNVHSMRDAIDDAMQSDAFIQHTIDKAMKGDDK